MKSMMKAKWILLVLAFFGLTLAIAGDVSASPCCDLEGYDAAGYKFLDTNPLDSTSTGGLGYNRLWLGSDTTKVGPGGVAINWMFQQYYDSSLPYAYHGYSYYKLDLHTAVAQNGGGTGPFEILVRSTGALQVFLNGSSTPVLNLLSPNPTAAYVPGSGFNADQFSNGSFFVDFSNASLLNSFGNIPIEVVYTFDNIVNTKQVASGFDLDLNNNPIVIPHTADMEPCLPSRVPEPSTLLLLGFGLVGLAGYGRKRFKR